MARILYIATSDIHLKTFHLPYLKWLHDAGHEIDIVAEQRSLYSFEHVQTYYRVDFPRKITVLRLWHTFKKLKQIISARRYDLIHCHTPIPSALIRLAAMSQRKDGLKVLYTAHGFHFYRGAPWSYWLTYFPVEYWLSKQTDGIVTINQEDFAFASSWLRSGKNYLIPGIGVDTKRFRPVPSERRREIRARKGFLEEDFLILYTAEFIVRKDHAFVLDAAEQLLTEIPNAKILFLGTGVLIYKIQSEIQHRGLNEQVLCLGFREDVENYAAIADIGISSSRHEGLGLGLLEQMACGVPVVASMTSGHRELIDDGINGLLYKQGDCEGFCQRVIELSGNMDLRKSLGRAALAKAEKFSVDQSLSAMKKIYNELLP